MNIKKQFDDIIIFAYKSDTKLDSYLKYYINFEPKTYKSFAGQYHSDTHTIDIILGSIHNNASAVLEVLHNLSHHILYCQCKSDAHDERFYAIYKKLLSSALRLKKVDPDECIATLRQSNPRSALLKTLESYKSNSSSRVSSGTQHDSPVSSGSAIICVASGYKNKNVLKLRNYFWNSLSKSWQKRVPVADLVQEINDLKKMLSAPENEELNVEVFDSRMIIIIVEALYYALSIPQPNISLVTSQWSEVKKLLDKYEGAFVQLQKFNSKDEAKKWLKSLKK